MVLRRWVLPAALFLGALDLQASNVRDLLLRGQTGVQELSTVPPVKVVILRLASEQASDGAPEVGVSAQAMVGESLYREGAGSRYEIEVVQLEEGVVIDAKGHQLNVGTIMAQNAKRESSWCADEIYREARMVQEPAVVCLDDADGNSVFDQIAVSSYSRPLLAPVAKYRKLRLPLKETSGANGRELVYLGAGGGVLRLRFQGGGEAPADITYDLAPEGPTTVAFRGAKIEVVSVSNAGVQYRVISGFSPALVAAVSRPAPSGSEGVVAETRDDGLTEVPSPMRLTFKLDRFDDPAVTGRVF